MHSKGNRSLYFHQVPESPIWLLGHKGEHETEVALKWLRGKPDVSKEIQVEVLKTKQFCFT